MKKNRKQKELVERLKRIRYCIYQMPTTVEIKFSYPSTDGNTGFSRKSELLYATHWAYLKEAWNIVNLILEDMGEK